MAELSRENTWSRPSWTGKNRRWQPVGQPPLLPDGRSGGGGLSVPCGTIPALRNPAACGGFPAHGLRDAQYLRQRRLAHACASLQRGSALRRTLSGSSPADAVPSGVPTGALDHPPVSGGQCRGAGLHAGRKLAVASGQFPLCLEPERMAAAINRPRAQKSGAAEICGPACDVLPELAVNVP